MEKRFVPALLRSVFPADRLLNEDISTVDLPQLNENWLSCLWKYIVKHFPSSLSEFENLPLIPSENRKLTKLFVGNCVIASSKGNSSIPSKITELLKKLGATVLCNVQSWSHNHAQLIGKYICAPDAHGVLTILQILSNRSRAQFTSHIEQLTGEEKRCLRKFIAKAMYSNTAQKDVQDLKSLFLDVKLFETVEGSGSQKSQFVSVQDVPHAAAPNNDLPFQLPRQILKVDDESELCFVKLIGGEIMSSEDLLTQIIFPAIEAGSCTDEQVSNTMIYVLKNFERFAKNRESFQKTMSNLSFIFTESSSLVMPSEVFDPNDPLLCSLFSGFAVFPQGEFCNERYRTLLKKLGMKNIDSVTANDVVDITRAMNSDSCTDQLKRATSLMKFLEGHSQLLNTTVNLVGQTLKSYLMTCSWVTTKTVRPEQYPSNLAFWGLNNSVMAPPDVCSSMFEYLIGSVLGTVDKTLYPNLIKAFQWDACPSSNCIVDHLLKLVSCWRPEDKCQSLISAFTWKIYEHLNKNADSLNADSKKVLDNEKWIWNGESFGPVNNFVLNKPPVGLQPHVHHIPADMQQFKKLWSAVNITPDADLVHVLHVINDLHSKSESMMDEDAKVRDLKMAIDILNVLAAAKECSRTPEVYKSILIPISPTDSERLCLLNIDKVTYVDKDYVHDIDGIDDTDEPFYRVHEDMSLKTAELLNIHTLQSRLVDSDDIENGYESYGQHEPLTRRLKTILRDYPDGLAVLKELIQNADDAGATEVRFLYDERINKDARDKLISPGLADFQGPAMWAYNNAIFTDSDFEHLIELSGATKEHRRDVIGRFGFGFNAVYNLTDVPSFISQHFFVMFDPHTKYLGRALRDKSKPGIKVDLRNKKLLQQCPNSFKPFNGLFGCDLGPKSSADLYPGTLFRFPLRMPSQINSEICNKAYGQEEVMNLLQLLHRSSEHLLLFTQCVQKLSVYHLSETATDPREMTEWFTITRDTVQVLRPMEICLNSGVSSSQGHSRILQSAKNLVENYMTECKNKMLCPPPKATKKTSKKQCAKEPTDVIQKPKLNSSVVMKITCECQKSTSELLECSPVEDHHWLVTSCLGQNKSLEMATTNSDLMPVGGIAVKLNNSAVNAWTALSLKEQNRNGEPHTNGGLLFCFLPLPCSTFLPVHLNGFFSVTSSRMHLYEKDINDKMDRRALWNEALMGDAITDAYLIAIEDVIGFCNGSDGYNLWPTHVALNDAGLPGSTIHLVDRIYAQMLCDDQPKLLRDHTGKLVEFSACRILEPSFRKSGVGDIALKCLNQIESCDFSVIDLPEAIVNTMLQTSVADKLKSLLINKVEFYSKWFPEVLNLIDDKERDTLVVFALLDDDLCPLLKDIGCIATNHGRVLRKPSELVSPDSFIAVLFDIEEERFPTFKQPMTESARKEVYSKLIKLGMVHDDLPWDEMVCRCKAIKNKPSFAEQRIKCFVALLNKKTENLEDHVVVQFLGSIKEIEFLPVLEMPKNFPLTWNNNEKKQFASCNDSFLAKYKYSVCCTHPVIDEAKAFDKEYNSLKDRLGLSIKRPGTKTILQQLDHALSLADTNGYVATNAHDGYQSREIVRYIVGVCEAVYKFFTDGLKREQIVDEEICALASRRCIFLSKSSTFVDPLCCAKQFHLQSEDLLPYLAELPSDFSNEHNVLAEKMGITESFSTLDFISTVTKIKSEIGENALHDRQLKCVKYIINECLFATLRESSLPEGIDALKIFVPDEHRILCTANLLSYKTAEFKWLEDEEVHFCHETILPQIASKLGVNNVQDSLFFQNSFGMNFGQSEELINRIKRILTGYPFGVEILKEMLQNADDAGATQIHFVLDKRTLPSERLFSPNWKHLQGPALLIYNNRPFTREDINGIQRLGEGSKSTDPVKTGRYGVGFNCVYHLTDVPTMLTTIEGHGRTFCVFDPNCDFAPLANKLHPGRMFTNLKKIEDKFSDVFKGYIDEQYGELGGTVFRLPLRNEESANLSKLSSTPVTVKQVEELFGTFKQHARECLLFLNSIQEIELQEISCNGTPETVYKIKSDRSKKSKKKRKTFNNFVLEQADQLKLPDSSVKNTSVREITYELNLTDGANVTEKWIIMKRFGFGCDSSVVPECVESAYQQKNIGLLPIAGLAYCISSTAKANEARADKETKRLFCILPLSECVTRLPVHINGHFALNHETRRNLFRYDQGSYGTEWNNCLMREVVAPAYCNFIFMMRDKVSASNNKNLKGDLDHYHSLFPDFVDHDDKYVVEMCKSVYRKLGNSNMPVLPVQCIQHNAENLENISWSGPLGVSSDCPAVFDDLHIQIIDPEVKDKLTIIGSNWSSTVQSTSKKVSNKEPQHTVVSKALVRCGMHIFISPLIICNNFERSDIKVCKITPDAVLNLLKTCCTQDSMCTITELPKGLPDTPFRDLDTLRAVLRYCCKKENYKQYLQNLPLLVTADNVLRMFDSEAVVFQPQFSDVLPHAPQLFMHFKVFKDIKVDLRKDCTLCKQLTVADFAQNLPDLLPSEMFCTPRGDPIEFSALAVYLNSAKPELWISKVWIFFNSFLVPSTNACNVSDVKRIVDTVNNWSLLPVQYGVKLMLLPICKAQCVLLPGGALPDYQISEIVFKFGVPYPWRDDRLHFPTAFYFALLGSSSDPVAVVLALQQSVKYSESQGKLTIYECEQLLKYLSKHIQTWKNIPESIESIQKLPIFITTSRHMISINDQCVYVLPSKIPSADMEYWDQVKDQKFLRDDEAYGPLLKHLGCQFLTATQVYCSCIFKQFEMLTLKGQVTHLEYVRDKLLPHLRQKEIKDEDYVQIALRARELEALLDCLSTLEFVPVKGGGTARAAFFYDPDNSVIKVMHDESDFPQEPYNSYRWTQFLRDCGMIHEVTSDMFEFYARSLTGKTPATVESQSRALIDYLFAKDDLTRSALTQRIKDIPFIPPNLVSQNKEQLHKQFGNRDERDELMLIPFNGSISSEFEDGIWTVQTILPSWADPSRCYFGSYKRKLQESIRLSVQRTLGIDIKPKVDNIVQHVQNLSGSLQNVMHRNTQVIEAYDVLKSIYRTLMNVNLHDDHKSLLAEAKFLIIRSSNMLIKPVQACINLLPTNEIKPYLMKLPLELGEFAALFQKIGTTESPTVEQYAAVLTAVYKNASDVVLLPDEREAVCKATGKLFALLKEGEELSDLTEFCLPSTDGKLHQSSIIVVNNDNSISGRLHNFQEPLLVDLNECGVNFTNREIEGIVESFPTYCRPSLLTEVVKNEIDRNFETQDSEFGQNVRAKLQSDEFLTGIERLIRHSGIELNENKLNRHIAETLNALRSIQVLTVNRITNFLVNIRSGKRIAGSDEGGACFVERDKSAASCKVFMSIEDLERSEHTFKPTVYAELAKIISSIAKDSLMCVILEVQAILSCEPGYISSILDQARIKRVQFGRREKFLFQLGEVIPSHLEPFFRPISAIVTRSKGDKVALVQHAPAEPRQLYNGQSAESQNTRFFVLVQIVECVETPAHVVSTTVYPAKTPIEKSCKYIIKRSENDSEHEQVSGSELYLFSRQPPRTEQPTDYSALRPFRSVPDEKSRQVSPATTKVKIIGSNAFKHQHKSSEACKRYLEECTKRHQENLRLFRQNLAENCMKTDL